MAYDLSYRGYYRGTEADIRWYRRQEILFWCPFNTERGVTQGYPVSPTIFNIVVDAVVRAVLLEVCRPQESHHGFRWSSGENNICFYADCGRIAGRNPIWVQTALTSMVIIFGRVRLQTNIINTKSMVFTLGFIGSNRGLHRTG